MAAKPNILFIVLDTQRRDRLSLYGHQRDTSPQLDAFAQDATIFERAIAPAQWTIPAHGSLFTGLYPGAHQLQQAHQALPHEHITLAEHLQAAGYHTSAFCNNPMVGLLETGLQRGFHHFFNYAGASPNRPVDMRRSAPRKAAATEFRKLARKVTNQFAHNDLMFKLSLNPLVVPIWSRLVNYKGNTERSIDDLIDYLGEQRAGGTQKPQFTFLNLMGTHTPYRPPRDVVERIAPSIKHDKHAWRFMTEHNADAGAWISPSDPPLEDWQRDTLSTFYDAEIIDQDVHLGRLFAYLEASGALDDTVVIVAADHGEGHGDHDFVGHSFVVYQELVHVPLIIHYPERFPAKRIPTNVSTRRIYHTILEMAGLYPDSDVEALSLTRSLNGVPDPEGGIAFSEAFPPDNLLTILDERMPGIVTNRKLTQVRRGVYDGDHKLAMVGDDVENLFHVASDPSEVSDVAEEKPDLAETLRQRVSQFVDDASKEKAKATYNGGVSKEMMDNLRALGYIE